VAEVFKTVPNFVWGCITVVFLGVLTSFVVLSVNGSDATELSRFINSLMNLGGLILGSIGAAGGAGALVYAKKAADQTNGPLTASIHAAVKTALKENSEVSDNGRSTL
jgi:hypothetical protein